MKIYLDCYPCFVNQSLRAARLAGADDPQQLAILRQTFRLLENLPPGANPPEIGYAIYGIVRDAAGESDPYAAVKRASTRQALALYAALKDLVRASSDPLDAAIRVSIAGNIIDFAISDTHADLWQTVERVLRQTYAIDHTAALRARLQTAPSVLYIADNAGETVFDRVLIEELPVPVTYAVKGGAVVNDATLQDALDAGLDGCARLVSNGAQASGTILSLCSEEFRQQFAAAPLVIAKGQANYETLSTAGAHVFCLLQIKCAIIGSDIGAPAGSIVARQSIGD